MHCPQCGRQITSADARFCKQCGFALDGVKDLLNHPATGPDDPPSLMNITVGADPRSLRGINQSAYLLLLALVPLLLAAAQGLFGLTLLPAMLLMKAFFALLALPVLRFGYAVYEAKREWKPKGAPRIGGGTRRLELPAARRAPAEAFGGRQIDTAEVVQPPSVTEPTTKLLKRPQDR